MKSNEINIDIEKLALEYLEEGATTYSLAEKYGCHATTIHRKLKKSKNKSVFDKFEEVKRKMVERKPSKIYIEDNLICIVASNTGKIYYFDKTDENMELLNGKYYSESPNGHLSNSETFVHRIIYDGGIAELVDHINGNPCDNRKSNLREATLAQNRINAKLNSNNATGYKGVCYRERTNKYRAYIYVKKKYIELGSFNSVEKAYEARVKAELKYYGDFARIDPEFEYLRDEFI